MLLVNVCITIDWEDLLAREDWDLDSTGPISTI